MYSLWYMCMYYIHVDMLSILSVFLCKPNCSVYFTMFNLPFY